MQEQNISKPLTYRKSANRFASKSLLLYCHSNASVINSIWNTCSMSITWWTIYRMDNLQPISCFPLFISYVADVEKGGRGDNSARKFWSSRTQQQWLIRWTQSWCRLSSCSMRWNCLIYLNKRRGINKEKSIKHKRYRIVAEGMVRNDTPASSPFSGRGFRSSVSGRTWRWMICLIARTH